MTRIADPILERFSRILRRRRTEGEEQDGQGADISHIFEILDLRIRRWSHPIRAKSITPTHRYDARVAADRDAANNML
ncbi:hypothetical protein [Methylosinus sp. PW1]|uniref:hypothetical protein n=1 Tax=Methylosinus sp. PW1 TaxID=107636 RepID=UPI0012EC8DAF|nr:hypothetical protein [Methylosinus sp. PW1]